MAELEGRVQASASGPPPPRPVVASCSALLAHADPDHTALYHRLLPRDVIAAVDSFIEANAWRWSDAARLSPMALPPLTDGHTVLRLHRTVLADGEAVLFRSMRWAETMEGVPYSEYVRSFEKRCHCDAT